MLGGSCMGAISRWLDRFCYKHPRLGIPGLMKYIVIANVAVYLMDMFSNGYFSARNTVVYAERGHAET